MRSIFLALGLIVAIIIAVALLIELMAAKQGLIGSCQCSPGIRRIKNVCSTRGQKNEFYFMEVRENMIPTPIDKLLAIHKKVYLDDRSSQSLKVDDVERFAPNHRLKAVRGDESCVCPGDWVCFPQYKEKP